MKVLITRPMADAVPFAKALNGAGYSAVIEPMIRIRPLSVPDPEFTQLMEGVSGLLFTSANGVRAFSERCKTRNLTAWCVGMGSAAAARHAGFSNIETAGGDVEMLSAHVRAHSSPEAGPLLHVAGSHRAGDLSALLTQAGFEVRRVVLYQAHARSALTSQTRDALRSGHVDVLTLFSPRTARLLSELAISAGLKTELGHLTVISLSQAVRDAFTLPVKQHIIARARHQDAVVSAIHHLAG